MRMVIHLRYVWILLALVLLAVLQYRLWFDDSGVVASRSLQGKIEQLHEDNAQQQGLNDVLMSDVMDLRNGDALLEETARENLGLVKEGETFILFAEPSED